ncbi:hypothetical protein D5W64_12755 [Salmonella enterica subsp. enterica serovar Saintpaul]|nr:hypothetical protein [Salmonella enterica subsp. enterica serovar Saintpaul]
MKDIIRGKSQAALTGSLIITRDIVKKQSDAHQDQLVIFRLKQEYPEFDLRVFATIISTIAMQDGFRVPLETFRELLRKELLKLVTVIFPDHVFNERTNVHTLYETVFQFLEDRDNKIKAYKG